MLADRLDAAEMRCGSAVGETVIAEGRMNIANANKKWAGIKSPYLVRQPWIVLSVLSIFLSGIVRREYILVAQLVLILVMRKIKIDREFVLVMIFLTVHAGLSILLGRDTVSLAAKQIVAISINYVFYRSIIENRQDALDALRLYKRLAVGVAMFAIIQQVAFYMHIEVIYDLRWLVPTQSPPDPRLYRSATIFGEPSDLARILLPMAFLALYSVLGRYRHNFNHDAFLTRREAIVVLLGFVVAFSSAGFIGLFLGVLLIWLEYRHDFRQIVVLLLGMIGFVLVYTQVDFFRIRMDDTLALLFDAGYDLGRANLSSQTIIINFRIAIKSLIGSYGLGGGIGSHPISYSQFIGELPIENVTTFLNKEDANSLLLRIMSELGVPGLVYLAAFLIRFWPKHSDGTDSTISKMCVAVFMLRLLRQGHYFAGGVFFWVVVYIATSRTEGTDGVGESQAGSLAACAEQGDT